MRLRPTCPPTLLAVLAAATCSASPAALAANSPGGSAAPASGSRVSVAPNVPRSAIATWFGPGFYGQKTACGQTLTPAVIGVAHRTLPCGTLVRVSYKGHALTLPVLDRGPYGHGADWDLTAGAAAALDITDTVRIHTRVIGSTRNTARLGLPAVPAGAARSGGALAG
jgi:rare lipoprotein A (peptidoglycan hydrolase)